MNERVFISSTCFDLLDLRAELEVYLESLGLSVLLSDSLIGEFSISGLDDSISSCLKNVEQCDYFVIVLSQRYGPNLSKFGQGQFSATHLEYRHAKLHNKPIFFYVRDRLYAEYSVWKASDGSSSVKTRWCKQGDQKLFELIEEHSTWVSGGGTNWYWQFRSSIDLKQSLLRDLQSPITRSLSRRLIASSEMPCITIECDACPPHEANKFNGCLVVRNIAGGTAIAFDILGPGVERRSSGLILGEKLTLPLNIKANDGGLEFKLHVSFRTIGGWKIHEEHLITCGQKWRTRTNWPEPAALTARRVDDLGIPTKAI